MKWKIFLSIGIPDAWVAQEPGRGTYRYFKTWREAYDYTQKVGHNHPWVDVR